MINCSVNFLHPTIVAHLIALSISHQSYSQPAWDSIEHSVNYLLKTFDVETELNDQSVSSLIESLISYIYNPIDLNTCSYAELASFPLLDERIAKDIMSLRDELGIFSSFSDLLLINSITLQFIQAVKPFIVISDPIINVTSRNASTGRSAPNPRTTLISQSFYRQLEKPDGYSISRSDGGFSGSPTSLYTRISSVSSKGISMRLSLEKDAGESISWDPAKNMYGADHIEMAVSISPKSFLKQVVIGNYTSKFGQGLLFSSLFSSQKGTDPTRLPIGSTSRIRPSSSRSEGNSFRGAAATLALTRSLDVIGFYSDRNRDASLAHHEDSTLFGITSINSSGLHRTDSEINRKGQAKEVLWGASLAYTRTSANLGVSAYSSRFNYPFLAKSSVFSNSAEFTGRHISGWSFWGTVKMSGTEASWEIAKSNPGTYALLSRILFRPSASISISILFRTYSNRFFSFYGKSFGEQNTLRSETGIYTGSRLNLSDELTGFIFFDLFETVHKLPGGFQKPITGIEAFAKIVYSPRPWLTSFIEYRLKSKPARAHVSASHVHLLHSSTAHTKQVCKFRLEYVHSKTLKLKTHIETRFGNLLDERSRGILFYQDLAFHPAKHTKFHLRFSIFDSNRNDTILYAFENDLQYKFGIRSYSGQGVRNVLLIRHSFSNEVILEVKYATTRYPDQTLKSTGINATTTSRIREISGQISLRI